MKSLQKKLSAVVLLIAVSLGSLSLTSCSDDDTAATPKNYVLVHGAWQAPYVWDMVKAKLEAKGNHVTVVELPGHGSDQTPPQQVSLQAYKDKVVQAISQIDGKVILVGHSLGGIIISSVAEQIPTKIEKLVYLAAYLPASGQSLNSLASTDTTSLLSKNLIFNPDSGIVDVQQDQLVDIFIQDGTPELQNLVVQKYRTEPLYPLNTPVMLTAANFGSVSKVYIKTLRDHAVTPILQGQMISAAGVTAVYEVDAGHSPFLTQPDALTTLLITIAK